MSDFECSGIKNLRLSLTVKNLMDREPPLSNNDPRTLGFALTDDIVGRYTRVAANYAF